MLFNLAMEKIIRDAGVQTHGNILYKSVQILAYSDDIDICGKNGERLKTGL